MEKVKKEIRVTFNLENEMDRELYQKILNLSKTQPGRVVKRIVAENIDNDISNQNGNNVNIKLLEVLDKLSNKIDNLTTSQNTVSNATKLEPTINQVDLTANISSQDLDDIDF
ncbi:hypothetical protein [Paraclostridium sordellii]|uniref:hypothetical protein n=1 Tax=Paraclostridium sordellii TaxID=1505 RepID=UPI000E4C2590|nr:hypothetical protein [Paeniclostridium sordellii]RGX09340.1 hypothetical protein DWV40_07530 [Paeniclostridium sordellii]